MKVRTALLALLVFAGQAVAGDVDKPRLRKLAKLPTITVTAGIYFSTTYGFSFTDEKPNPHAEIVRLRKQLKGDAGDAERYRRLGLLYAKEQHKKESAECCDKAIALCRRQVKEYPDDMRWLAQLGDILAFNGETQEGEKLLRRAVKKAPREWRAWLSLARCLDGQALAALTGDEYFSLHSCKEEVIIPALLEKKPTAAQIAQMRRLHDEARRYYDRAVTLAPQETQPYFWRVASNWLESGVEIGLRKLKGEKVAAKAMLFTPRCATDMRQIARLSPNDPKVIAAAMLVDIGACALHRKPDVGGEDRSLARDPWTEKRPLGDLLPAENRDFHRWGKDRLEQLTKSADKGTAAAASEILADVLIMLQSMENASSRQAIALPVLGESEDKTKSRIAELYHRAVQLDPSRERAWDALWYLLMEEERIEEALRMAGNRLKIKDNAHNRFLLAKIHANQDHDDNAAEQLWAGLKSDPNDLNCRLGLVAVLLKRDDAEALKQAGDQLDATETQLKRDGKQPSATGRLLRGLHTALSDRPDQAKAIFKQLLHQDADNPAAARALAALGRPLDSNDALLAIAYLRRLKGKIERADERPDSPVRQIWLMDIEISDDDLFFLSAFPALRDLQFYTRSITDAGMVHLEALEQLEKLEIEDITRLFRTRLFRDEKPKITDVGLAHLRKLPRLRHLELRLSLTDKGLAHVAALPKLRRLYLSGGKLTDEGMKHFAHCTELRELWLNCDTITGTGLVHLKELRHLRELRLIGDKITETGLAALNGLTRLEILNLSGTAITDAGLAQLSGLTNLRELNLSGPLFSHDFFVFPGQKPKKPTKPAITETGMKHLRTLAKLEKLDLARRPLTDAGLAQLAGLRNLRDLSLSKTSIGDAGLAHLHGLKQLEFVRLDDTKVSREGIAQLRKVLPKLEIFR